MIWSGRAGHRDQVASSAGRGTRRWLLKGEVCIGIELEG
jgi:hypothetical protein